MTGHQSIPPEVQRRVAEATAALVDAERELERVMREIAFADRADKRIISEVLQAAFDKVKLARQKLDGVLRDN